MASDKDKSIKSEISESERLEREQLIELPKKSEYSELEQISRERLRGFFEAIMNEIGFAKALLDSGKDSIPEAIVQNLNDFSEFSSEYFRLFFYYRMPPLIVSQLALEKIQHEWLSLYPLFEQHNIAIETEYVKPPFEATDVIADSCIEMSGVDLESDKRAKCVTVFEKMFDIHLYYSTNPIFKKKYQRVPTIAIPKFTWNHPWLWMGIAHEIGHHIWDYYNLGEKIVQNLVIEQLFSSEAMSNRKHLILFSQWLEEIFADIYGVLILGPAYVNSLMAWLTVRIRIDGETLLEDDQDHPPPILRPLIQIEVLKKLREHNVNGKSQKRPGSGKSQNDNGSDELSSEIDRIEKRWRDFFNDFGGYKYWLRQNIGDYLVGEYEDSVPKFVDIIWNSLQPIIDKFDLYSIETHDKVDTISNKLASNPDDNETISNEGLPLALVLSVTWYAWQKISLDKRLTTGRIIRLNNVRKWMLEQTIGHSDDISQQTLEITDKDSETEVPESLMELFKELLEEQKMEDPEVIIEQLLQEYFSTIETHGGPGEAGGGYGTTVAGHGGAGGDYGVTAAGHGGAGGGYGVTAAGHGGAGRPSGGRRSGRRRRRRRWWW
jgi:hypothetical protein